ncbi:MAG TPA: hypothetical protein VMF89_07450, partial [Polyangiales bacterium]|nr:hypothetical protein [Polyangiales bacterium]
ARKQFAPDREKAGRADSYLQTCVEMAHERGTPASPTHVLKIQRELDLEGAVKKRAEVVQLDAPVGEGISVCCVPH